MIITMAPNTIKPVPAPEPRNGACGIATIHAPMITKMSPNTVSNMACIDFLSLGFSFSFIFMSPLFFWVENSMSYKFFHFFLIPPVESIQMLPSGREHEFTIKFITIDSAGEGI